MQAQRKVQVLIDHVTFGHGTHLLLGVLLLQFYSLSHTFTGLSVALPGS